ncbi:MAG TPA: DUF6249 domain-containing protein [Candidatus Acidoferrales bacterium]|nr:DUF6249 domain-containing protein [Candidatus Acidoferrales bacterium]
MLNEVTGLIAVVLIFGALPAAVVLIYYFSRKAKHRERLALIEKGIDASTFMKSETIIHDALMWGMLIIGIGLGLLLGDIVSTFTPLREEYTMPSMSLLFGGLGLVCFYAYRRKAEMKSAQ